MALRKGHGMGAGVPRIEVLPANEQPTPPAEAAVPLEAGRDPKGRVVTTAAARALASLPRRTAFLTRKLTCDPRFEIHNDRRLDWLRGRRAEYVRATGQVSRGVGAMLSSAAWLYAAGEFAAERGAETGEVEWFKSAGSLTATARQHELGAWELSCRETATRPVENPHTTFFQAFGASVEAPIETSNDERPDASPDSQDPSTGKSEVS